MLGEALDTTWNAASSHDCDEPTIRGRHNRSAIIHIQTDSASIIPRNGAAVTWCVSADVSQQTFSFEVGMGCRKYLKGLARSANEAGMSAKAAAELLAYSFCDLWTLDKPLPWARANSVRGVAGIGRNNDPYIVLQSDTACFPHSSHRVHNSTEPTFPLVSPQIKMQPIEFAGLTLRQLQQSSHYRPAMRLMHAQATTPSEVGAPSKQPTRAWREAGRMSLLLGLRMLRILARKDPSESAPFTRYSLGPCFALCECDQ